MGAVGALERRRQDRTGGEPWGMAQFCFLFSAPHPAEGVLVLFFAERGEATFFDFESVAAVGDGEIKEE